MPKIVAKFNTVPEAMIAKAFLEVNGISAYVLDEHSSQLRPFLVPAMGWVRLQVADEDVVRALELLDQQEPV
ncbi:MAG: hypothetical protein CL678_10835 [Bdellovibrionaceae bacterium]|nr:hypothetical protein [Pseudobdellovibrionaceae bacterium]|tara:strand:- start:1253 stop:1468 length:216 start_codon:yes stop_codon:yes gene_type:complete